MKALKSRTVWTIALIFVVGGTEALVGVVPDTLTTPILFVLSVMATYFKVNPSQKY